MKQDGSEVKLILKPNPPFVVETPVWSPHGDELLYQHSTARQYQIFKIDVDGRRNKQLTEEGRNFLGDWFDPAALPVQPNAELLTTMWATLKQK